VKEIARALRSVTVTQSFSQSLPKFRTILFWAKIPDYWELFFDEKLSLAIMQVWCPCDSLQPLR
jgi:hypothetical protein